MNTRSYPYKQIIATFFDCSADLLDDKLLLKTTLTAIKKSHMKLAKTLTANPLVYKIASDIMGGGVSINALITASHLTVHTSNLHRTVEFDCATCGEDSDPEAALETFKKMLKPKRVVIW